MQKKTALYVRRNKELPGKLNITKRSAYEQATGLESQLRALRVYCEQQKIENYELYADENQSGTKASRPGLDRMMKAVQDGEIDSVIVFAFSRFARSVSHMLKGLEVMKKHGTNFISLTEKIDLNTSLGHVVFVILSAIAQLERDLIAERVRNGLANARAKGKRIGRLKTRNSVLIRSLLDAGLSLREVSRIAKCSHGSVSLEKSVYKKEKAEAKAKRDEMIAQGLLPPDESTASPTTEAATPAPADGAAPSYSFTYCTGGTAPAAT